MPLYRTWRMLLLWPLLLLAGCGTSLDDYRGQGPNWDLAHFFNGKLVAHGLVIDRSGEVTSRFRVEMQGRWREGKGELFEQFYFDDGRKQTRTWFLSKGADGHWRGTASDVVGEAVGKTAGFALNWRYQLDLALPDGEVVRVSFDDWMYLLDQDRLINRAEISKFGIHLGEVILYIERIER
ncbi:DUF3833 domain-containing protein [Aeromonas rivipollensis]|uniref:DUF3833 domain-containing protein n=1 Tax=Aeromonas rivipollensis TaxID=948519 RepID=A0ABX0D7G7_9GAMM|nr:DUF3833 domain-containing protein [Aeromonas rivipollensis]NEX89407.1 DUF3833 domain-containing protein [Aeromonas rivipollensis]NEY06555.1 DUF3833 domain-containing protein [Aeromonas rivipollensis]